VRPAALYNYNMFFYLDAKWFAPCAIDRAVPKLLQPAAFLIVSPNQNNTNACMDDETLCIGRDFGLSEHSSSVETPRRA
jgi:hypothetical protein